MKTRLLSLVLAWAVVHPLFAESFTTNIVDGFTTNITTEFILGDTGPYNFLLITNAGRMINHERVFIGNTVAAHNNTAMIVGTGSVWHWDEAGYLGIRSPSNRMAVIDGARFRAGVMAIGTYDTSSNNFLQVAGIGTRFTNQWLHFGTYGADNQFVVEDSAFAHIGGLIFNTEGRTNGGRQVATVRGSGTWLSITNFMEMTRAPGNMLVVTDGARFGNRSSIVGGDARSPGNQVLVSGPGTIWLSSGLVVGTNSSSSNLVIFRQRAEAQSSRVTLGAGASDNVILIDSGATFSGSQLIAGDRSGAARNRLDVTGPDSALLNSLTLTIGEGGAENSFTLSNGASAQTRDFGLGMQFTSTNNRATATGTNTVWVGRTLTVGSAGDLNTFSVEDGAAVFAASLLSGGQGGSGNTTRVTGAGSLLSLTNSLDLGGGNLLIVTNNGRVHSDSGVIGSFGPGNLALVSRASWSNVTSLRVGSQAPDNALRVSEIGSVYASNLVVGTADNSDRNRLEVFGKGTTLRILNELEVGSWGDTNTAIIANGASVSAAQLHVGGFFPPNMPLPAPPNPGDANVASIDGATTGVNVASNISVGYNGSWNRLEIRGGANLTSTSIEVGTRANSTNNTILVTDPGTHWRNTNTLLLGSNGYRNSLVISNGARFSSRDATIGAGGLRVPESPTCTNQIGWNEVLLTGTGSLWQAAGRISIAQGSQSNSVVLTRGGTLRARDIQLSLFAGSCAPYDNSNLLLVDGGALAVTNELFVIRGKFQMLGGRADVNSLFIETGPSGRMQIFGGTLRTGRIYASAPAEGEIGDGIHRATLELLPGNFFSSGRIIIARNSVLAGRGSIGGFTNAGTYGTLRAVTAITNASLGGSSGFDVWIQGTGAGVGHSMLQLSAPFNPTVIEGRLRVALSPSFRPQPTDEFRILTHGNATGAFDNAPHNSRINTVDNLASFRLFYTNNAVLLIDYRSTDIDGDSVDDAWATNYFGHSPLSFVERLSDSDGDGMSNYDEFRAGTDPTNAASALRVTAAIAGAGVTLRWPSVDGKTYRIYSSNDLQTWSEIVEPTLAFPEPGLCQWTDTGTDAGSPTGQMRFYRVAVE